MLKDDDWLNRLITGKQNVILALDVVIGSLTSIFPFFHVIRKTGIQHDHNPGCENQ